MAEASPTRIYPTGPEEWRPVFGFDGRYEVSSHGNVRRVYDLLGDGCKGGKVRRSTVKVLSRQRDKDGYAIVAVEKAPKPDGARCQRRVRIHCLVARAFIGPLPPGHHAAHLDGIRDNPCLANIAHVTVKENHSHKRVHGTDKNALRGEQSAKAKLTNEQVLEIRRLRKAHTSRELSNRQIGLMFGVCYETVRQAAAGESWAHI